MPFSTGLFDSYPDAPWAIVIYAGSVACFSVWTAVAAWTTLFVADHVLLRAFERSDPADPKHFRGWTKKKRTRPLGARPHYNQNTMLPD